jgi:hypothetical protein
MDMPYVYWRNNIFSSRDRNRDILSTFYSDIFSAILFDMCSDILIMIINEVRAHIQKG